jgi:hypothetical protein
VKLGLIGPGRVAANAWGCPLDAAPISDRAGSAVKVAARKLSPNAARHLVELDLFIDVSSTRSVEKPRKRSDRRSVSETKIS